MARGLYMGFEDIESKLSKLEDGPKLRELTRRVVYAGAKVLEKEIKASMRWKCWTRSIRTDLLSHP